MLGPLARNSLKMNTPSVKTSWTQIIVLRLLEKHISNRSTALRNSRLSNPIRFSKIWTFGGVSTNRFYGFEHVELARNHADEAHVGQHYVIWMEENGCTNWRDYFAPPTGNARGQYRKWPIPEEYHYDTWIAERTNALMEAYQQNGENFFLWASFFDPHPKYLVPEPWDTMYDPAELTVPSVTEGEHDNNPLHFQLTQQQKPDFSAWRESGKGVHGFRSAFTRSGRTRQRYCRLLRDGELDGQIYRENLGETG